MPHHKTIRYGRDAALSIEFKDGALVEHVGQPKGDGLDDPMAAVMASLDAPTDFPALAEATVESDSVVIAVGGPVPEIESLLSGIQQSLIDGGIHPDRIKVLLASADATELQALDFDSSRDPVRVLQHDPRDRMNLAYLASTQRGHTVFINRHICDADLVVTVGCIRPTAARGYFGVHGCVYPGFADIDTLRRFHSEKAMTSGSSDRQESPLAREVDEAGWLLGARFTVQVIPGGGDEILHILTGDVDVVSSEGARLSRKAWSCPVMQTSDLVIAALEGGSNQQTWQNLYRALEAASRIVNEDGAIVVCSELDSPLNEMTLRSLADHGGDPGSLSSAAAIEGDEPGERPDVPETPSLDTVRPRRMIPALRDVSLFLLSGLNEQLVEDLGMVPITRPSEIANLCHRHERCIVLSNAQHAWPELDDRAVSPA
jgi:hypothetical protein